MLPRRRCIFKKGGGNIETYCKTTVTKQNLKNDHIILHLHYFTLCRTCIYIPYIHVHKLFYFINYRLIMQCSISIIYCHYYYHSLTYKTVIISIAHVMKKQEVQIDFRTCSVLAKTICKLLSMSRSQSWLPASS